MTDLTTLHSFAEAALDFAVEHLRTHAQFAPMFQVLSAAGVDMFIPEGTATEEQWSAVKDFLAEKTRACVREKQAYAVVNVLDAWVIAVDRTHPLAGAARSGRYSTAQLEHMGVGKRRSIVYANLETPIHRQVLMQYYYRNTHGALILQERECKDEPGEAAGRFFGFFDAPRSA